MPNNQSKPVDLRVRTSKEAELRLLSGATSKSDLASAMRNTIVGAGKDKPGLLACAECGEDTMRLIPCCAHEDDEKRGRAIKLDGQCRTHYLCPGCFGEGVRAHTKAPGSIDACKFCVVDIRAGITDSGAKPGMPLRRERTCAAYEGIAPYLKAFAECHDSLGADAAGGEGTSLGTEIREGIVSDGGIKAFLDARIADGYPGELTGDHHADVEAYTAWRAAEIAKAAIDAKDSETAQAVTAAEQRGAARAAQAAVAQTAKEVREASKRARDAQKTEDAEAVATAKREAQAAKAALAAAKTVAGSSSSRGGGGGRSNPSQSSRTAAGVPGRERGVAGRSVSARAVAGESNTAEDGSALASDTPKAASAKKVAGERNAIFKWYHDSRPNIAVPKGGKFGESMIKDIKADTLALIAERDTAVTGKQKYKAQWEMTTGKARIMLNLLRETHGYSDEQLRDLGILTPAAAAAAADEPEEEEEAAAVEEEEEEEEVEEPPRRRRRTIPREDSEDEAEAEAEGIAAMPALAPVPVPVATGNGMFD